jgi:hypothetical protein
MQKQSQIMQDNDPTNRSETDKTGQQAKKTDRKRQVKVSFICDRGNS